MDESYLKQAKVIEEFYIGIQMFALVILVVATTIIVKADTKLEMSILTIVYGFYAILRFIIFVRKKYFTSADIEHSTQIYTSILDGLFIAAFIYINSNYVNTFTDFLYVFVVLQSIRYNTNKTYIFSTYASILHIGILLLINPHNIISVKLFISIFLYYSLNFMIYSALEQIEYLQLQRKYFQNEIIKKNKVLEELAYKDYLTNMSNHQSFYIFFDKAIKDSNELQKSISLILIDIDNFKNINDTYGHLAGDKVLKELSAILRKNIRKTDFSARYGGEEFALIFPDTDIDCAVKLSERLRKEVESHEFIIDEHAVKITISLGVGTYTPTYCVEKQHDFIDQVDKLLYEAKKSGKNQVKYMELQDIIEVNNKSVNM